MKTAALLFGLNYAGSDCALNGCINDVENVRDYLQEALGFADIAMFDDAANRDRTSGAGIMRELRSLVAKSWAEQLDLVWIHYSGHGTSVRDAGSEELDGKDECICPSDYSTAGLITDDAISEVLRGFNPATKVVCVFDCCHSGTIADLRWRYLDRRVRSQENARPETRMAKTLMMSGCRDDQTSADAFGVGNTREFSGALTSCLLGALRERPALTGDALGLLEDVRRRLRLGGFEQVPQLCASYLLDQAAEPLLL
jgi:hypothetical protein